MSRRAPILAGVASVVLGTLAVVLLLVPKSDEVDLAEERLQEAEEQELVLDAHLSQLQAASENVPEFRKRLERFQQSVPPVAQLPALINQLQDAADVAGVDFFSIAPSDPGAAPQGGAAEIPAQIQVVGGFFPVDEFLFRLETMERASKVMAVEIKAGPDGLPQIDMTLDTRFYTTDLNAGPGKSPVEGTTGTTAPPQTGGVPSPAASVPTTGA